MAFTLPQIEGNSKGWGPTSSSLTLLKEVPDYYSPYNKGDKLGKAADWLAPQHGNLRQNRPVRENQQSSNVFGFTTQEDESDFIEVDRTSKSAAKKGGFVKRNIRGGAFVRGGRGMAPGARRGRGGASSSGRGGQRGAWGNTQEAPAFRKREYSVEIKESWTHKEDIDFSTLTKQDEEPKKAQILKSCGEVKYYDSTLDRITSNSNKSLKHSNTRFVSLTTSEDPILSVLRHQENMGSGATFIFATDAIISHLMCANRSIIPWDLVITKDNAKIFIDIREGSNFDRVTVNENSSEPPTEEKQSLSVNTPTALSKEATLINQDLSQQLLTNETGLQFDGQSPFGSEEHQNVGFQYKKWDLGDGFFLIGRCEVNAVNKSDNKKLLIRAVNEYDPKITGDWRKKIDTQRGVVLASDAKSNYFKYTKWAIQSLLSGVEAIKLGFVTRASSARDYQHHILLSIAEYDPKEFISQAGLNLNERNMWGIMKFIAKFCAKQENGKYILLRDNEQPKLRLYSVPDSFEQQKEEPTKEDA